MPTYIDPISTEELEIDHTTIIYLVKIDNSFRIGAISQGINQLTADPITRANSYWLIDTDKLLREQTRNPHIFIDNLLSTGLLTSEQVQEFLNIDTNTLPTPFDTEGQISRQHQQQYAQHMDNPAHHEMNRPNPNRDAFFRPVQAQNGQPAEFLESRPQQRADIVAAGNNLFTLDDISRMDARTLSSLRDATLQEGMRSGPDGEPPLFTIADIARLDWRAVVCLKNATLQEGMRSGPNGEPPLFTIADIARLDWRAVVCLKYATLQEVMRSGPNGELPQFTIEDIVRLDWTEVVRLNNNLLEGINFRP